MLLKNLRIFNLKVICIETVIDPKLMRICSVNMPSLLSTQLFMYFQMDPKSVFRNPFTQHSELNWENKVNLSITNTDQYVALILIKNNCFYLNQVLRRLQLLSMSYCCRKRENWGEITNQVVVLWVSQNTDQHSQHWGWFRPSSPALA